MRKTTRTVMTALMRGESCACGNTATDGFNVYLHGNRIVDHRYGSITLAGHNTATTRERVNGYLAMIGSQYRVRQINGVPYFGTDDDPKGTLMSNNEWLSLSGTSTDTDEWGLMEA